MQLRCTIVENRFILSILLPCLHHHFARKLFNLILMLHQAVKQLNSFLPSALLGSLEGVQGFDKASFEAVHVSGEQVTSIRLNRAKIKSLKDVLPGCLSAESKVPWNTDGYYLSQRPSFTLDPHFHAGGYYVQEASSMFLQQALQQTTDLSQPLKVLDLCAAPGGKSTLLQSLINDKSLLVSNEIIKSRVTILTENITKWGAANVIVTNNKPKDFERLPHFFDVIVIDAPCSGSGLFRKDPAAVEEWSIQNVAMCSMRQQQIITDVLPSLKEGGVLIYSTCSYSESEDEGIADWLMENIPGLVSKQLQVQAGWQITATTSARQQAFGYRFYPDKIKGEGFFIAAFVKGEKAEGHIQLKKPKAKYERVTAAEIACIKSWLKDAGQYFFIRQNDEILAVPLHMEDALAFIQACLYIKKAGINIGTLIRNELVPGHEFALSDIVNDTINSIALTIEEARQYLRRQELSINADVKGWALVTYNQSVLGWVKVLPNRINNYYPKEWRILHK